MIMPAFLWRLSLSPQEHKPPPILRPVELTLVPDCVSTFEDVANTLTRAAEVCTLLSNQRTVMKNTFFLRASLITHLVTRVSERTRIMAFLVGGTIPTLVVTRSSCRALLFYVRYANCSPRRHDFQRMIPCTSRILRECGGQCSSVERVSR